MVTSWSDLTPELQERVAHHLPSSDVACSLRVINKAAAELFRGASLVQLSEPVPPHAFVWRWGSPAAYRSLTLESRRQLLALTAESGILSNLQIAVNASGCWPDESALTSAASGCHLHICEWLTDQDSDCWTADAVEAAASKGHIGLVRWMISRGYEDANKWAWRGAARGGRRDVCEALRADAGASFVVPPSAVYGAAKGGHADLVQWLLPYVSVEKVGYPNELLHYTAVGCDLAGLQHVYDLRPSVQQDGWRPLLEGGMRLLLAALTSPTPDWRAKVDWLRARGCAPNIQTFRRLPQVVFSLDFNLPDTLQPSDRIERALLYLQLLPVSLRGVAIKDILRNAIHLAAPELVDFALEQWPQAARADLAIVACSQSTTDTLMKFGRWWFPYEFETPAQVVVAARLAAAGVPIWPTVVKAAIQTGSLQMLQWMAAGADAAGQEGVAVDGERVSELEGIAVAGPEVRAAAAAALRAALERSGAGLASLAAEAGNLEMMQWLRAHGCAWDGDALTKAVQAGNIALLEWMVEEGFPLPSDSSFYKLAIGNEDMAVLGFLRRLGLPWGPKERQLLGLAVGSGCRVELLAWLVEEGCMVDWEGARVAAAALKGTTAQSVRAFIEQSAR